MQQEASASFRFSLSLSLSTHTHPFLFHLVHQRERARRVPRPLEGRHRGGVRVYALRQAPRLHRRQQAHRRLRLPPFAARADGHGEGHGIRREPHLRHRVEQGHRGLPLPRPLAGRDGRVEAVNVRLHLWRGC